MKTTKAVQHDLDVYTVSDDDGSVAVSVVPEMGAAVSSLVMPGLDGSSETMYLHPFFWDKDSERTRGGFPFIFPICARLERDGEAGMYLHDGRRYRMKSHGFSMRVPWRIAEQGESGLTVELLDTEATREQYPFSFRVTLKFSVGAGGLTIEQEYQNRGDKPMPYYAGFHPYFLTPGPGEGKEDVKVDYTAVRCLAYNEKLTDIIGDREIPDFPASAMDPGINEILTRVADEKETRLVLPSGMTIHMVAEGAEDPDLFPYVQLYTMPDKPFFCVEPWMSHPNSLNTLSGARWLEPGQSEHGLLKVWTSNE